MNHLSCFKAYDIRGELGDELNEDIAYRIGCAYAQFLKPKTVALGGDIRLSSPKLKSAVAEGLMDMGVDVIDLGMTGTEEVYFAAQYLEVDGGIEVTASHNPINFNGMKLVRENARPISGDTGLKTIQKLAESFSFKKKSGAERGSLTTKNLDREFVLTLMNYIEADNIRPLKIVCNAGNGAAGHVIDQLEMQFKEHAIPIAFLKIYHEPDGTFPNGIPNPILIENRAATAQAVIDAKADFGIAWDGDFDRCFFFDEKGQFIEGYYIVGLLAQTFLRKHPNSKIIHDPRLTWNTIDIAQSHQGIAIQSKTGHAFIKERMRAENAIYGGEMSAHHYFRDFAYCDSGMIPWLLIAELVSITQQKLSALVEQRIKKYPSSGEINFKLEDKEKSLQKIEAFYSPLALARDNTDGMSFEFEQWRFNLRSSNTEPVVRLNVETRQNLPLLKDKVEEIVALLHS